MEGFVDRANGWMVVFRVVTPALLGVLIWVVTSGQRDHEARLKYIELKLDKLSNEYMHELSSIKERLAGVEMQLRIRLR